MIIYQLPGWQGSGAEHWQTLWEQAYGDLRVEQSDWIWPRRGDWMARLDQAVLARHEPVVLVSHSLGCQLVASWAAHSSHTERVQCAMLVAPPDTERDDMPPNLFNWRPISMAPLPFKTLVVASSDDPFCTADRSHQFAKAWRADYIDVGPHGHLNAASNLGAWPEGRKLLDQLVDSTNNLSQGSVK